MFARLLALYPTGILISELLLIHEGKFVVRASVQVNGITRATGMACADHLELAEDRARSRALMLLLPDAISSVQSEMPSRHPSGTSEAQPVAKPSLLSSEVAKKQPSSLTTTSDWNGSISSSLPALPAAEESPLTPADPPKLAVENYGVPVAFTPVTPALVAGQPSGSMYDPQQEFVEEVVIPFGDEEPVDSSDYSYGENIPAPAPVAEVKKRVNMTQVFAQTTTQLKRLDWNTQQGRSYLKQTYGKTSRQQLTDDELLGFLDYLESQPTPNQLPLE